MPSASLPKRIHVAHAKDGGNYLYVADVDSFDDGQYVGTYELVETSSKRITHELVTRSTRRRRK